MYSTTLLVWIAFAIIAFFYVRRFRHPSTPLLAAYLLFVSLFTLTAFVIFAAGTWLLHTFGAIGALSNPVWAGPFLTIVFVPAFLVARWQLGKPPRQRMPGEPDEIIGPDERRDEPGRRGP
jgi:predicted Kef-type K+ transport protein